MEECPRWSGRVAPLMAIQAASVRTCLAFFANLPFPRTSTRGLSILGVCQHEIGTHFLRRANDVKQVGALRDLSVFPHARQRPFPSISHPLTSLSPDFLLPSPLSPCLFPPCFLPPSRPSPTLCPPLYHQMCWSLLLGPCLHWASGAPRCESGFHSYCVRAGVQPWFRHRRKYGLLNPLVTEEGPCGARMPP